jgi:hypothetical protein
MDRSFIAGTTYRSVLGMIFLHKGRLGRFHADDLWNQLQRFLKPIFSSVFLKHPFADHHLAPFMNRGGLGCRLDEPRVRGCVLVMNTGMTVQEGSCIGRPAFRQETP